MLLTGSRSDGRARHRTHVPLSDVIENLRASEIVRVGHLLQNFLDPPRPVPADRRRGFESARWRKSGKLGREEIEIIAPAVDELQRIHANALISRSVFAGHDFSSRGRGRI